MYTDMILCDKSVLVTSPTGLPHALRKTATIHQATTMLATSKNVLFLGHNHVLTTGTDDPSLARAWAIIKVSGHQYWWLPDCYDLEIGHF